MNKSILSKNQVGYLRIALLIILPTLAVLISFLLSTYHYQKTHLDILKENCLSQLKSFANESENILDSMISVSQFFSEDENIVPFLKDYLSPDADTSRATQAMREFTDNYMAIDSIDIISPKTRLVLSETGMDTIWNYFQDNYTYSNYSASYWENFRFVDTSAYRILSPTLVSTGEETQNIIPIVIKKSNSSTFRNYLIVNIRLNYILEKSFNYKYTQNSESYLLNKFTGEYFSNESDNSGVNILNTALYDNLISDSSSFNYQSGQNKYFVVCVSSTNSLLGYTYYTIIPYDDFDEVQTPFKVSTFLILLFAIVITVLLTVFTTAKIVSPLAKIAKLYDGTEVSHTKKTDILKHIENSAKMMVSKNEELSMMLPYAQEKYLINYLNSSDYAIGSSAKELLNTSLPFKHSYFASIIVHMYPTNALFSTYTETEYSNIQLGFYNVVKDIFNNSFDTFVISSEKEILYIVLNMEKEEDYENSEEILSTLKEFLKNDMDLIELYIGRGNVYKGLEGLKQSHTEAVKNLKITPKPKEQIIISPVNQIKNHISYIFTNTDENNLFNLLISNDIDNALKLINNISSQNSHIDIRSQKQFYQQILSTILKVLKIKKIPYDVQNRGDIEFLSNILALSITEIHRYTLKLMNSIQEAKPSEAPKADSVIDYIEENYTDSGLCLDSIGSKFNVQISYISKIIKDKLGIGFHEYLTGLRIAKSKEYLTNSDKTIVEIFQSVGFSSKQTFFRTFKKATGMTPAEYRKQKN